MLVFAWSSAQASEDSVFVKLQGDTVHVWNARARTNCCSHFVFDVSVTNDTLVVVERDTSSQFCYCDCYFDFSTSVVGLSPGSYVVKVYRNLHFWTDTTFFVGLTSFTIGTSASSFKIVYQYQSTCEGSPVKVERSDNLPDRFELEANYPNPFNPTTEFRYEMPEARWMTLKIYDVLGREVATVVNEVKQPGKYTVQWDAANAPSGVYWYRLQAGTFTQVKKMVLIR